MKKNQSLGGIDEEICTSCDELWPCIYIQYNQHINQAPQTKNITYNKPK